MIEVGSIFAQRYEVLAKIGEGGTGAVFKVRDIDLNSICALKLLSASMVGDKETRDRFLREGKSMSRISHMNVARVLRLGVETEPYLIMEYLEGKSLRMLLQNQEPLPVSLTLDLVAQTCEGMTAAHESNILHRDLKPDNIMVVPVPDSAGKFTAKILDFGLARFKTLQATQSQHLTQTGQLVGSVHYMSPEQCIGQRVDERSDIYALGCVLFECLTGRPPFDADSPIGLLHKHRYEDIPELPGPHTSEIQALNAVIAKALAKTPAQRYSSMQEFHDALIICSQGNLAQKSLQKKYHRAKTFHKIVIPVVAGTATLGLACAYSWQSRDREFSLPKNDNQPRNLQALEDALTRTRRNFDKGSESDRTITAKSLHRRIAALREEYWRQAKYEPWFALYKSTGECCQYISAGKSIRVKTLCADYHHCYVLSRTLKEQAQQQLWKKRAQTCLSEVNNLVNAGDIPFGSLYRDIAYCTDNVRQGNFTKARVLYKSALAAMMARNSIVDTDPILGVDAATNWRAGTAGAWLDQLIAFDYCQSAQDALDWAEMIAPLAGFCNTVSTSANAVNARKRASQTLQTYFPSPPADPAIRLRLDKVLHALEKGLPGPTEMEKSEDDMSVDSDSRGKVGP